MRSGQEARARSRVIAGTVALRLGIHMRQSAEHRQSRHERLQRLQARGQRIERADVGRKPLRPIHAVGKEDECNALRRRSRRAAGEGAVDGQRRHRLEPGQRDRATESAQCRSS
jgi:hypothetical protein